MNANKGEWSELYVLAHILSFGGLYGGDLDLQKKTNLFYKISQIIYEDKKQGTKLIYELLYPVTKIYINGEKVASINSDQIKPYLLPFFNEIKKGKGSYYSYEGNELLKKLFKNEIKAPSLKKNDIDLILFDSITKLQTNKMGFSIKSQIGSPATLLNASKATNFIYQILDSNNNLPVSDSRNKLEKIIEDQKNIKGIKERVNNIRKEGFQIKFDSLQNKSFLHNLLLIDSNLPNYISNLLLNYYSNKGTTLFDLLDHFYNKKIIENSQARLKIREFISTMALGMFPSRKWDGNLSTLGGFILLKNDSEILTYYLDNIEEFQDYLINNCKFETASSSRHEFGQVFFDGGKFYIKLNLQIRFIK
jgi:hypothetical protein